ncbi:MAG TPA: hypothetical protein VMG35_30385 [Bryobacteraceae bacterium]|nr:hypothetical protein [Bryobacteraceae bacterium]
MLGRELPRAARTLARTRGFTAAAVATIALGVGAVVALFSVIHAVLLRPLPYRDPQRLVFAISDMRRRNVKDFPFSNADFMDLRPRSCRHVRRLGRRQHRARPRGS